MNTDTAAACRDLDFYRENMHKRITLSVRVATGSDGKQKAYYINDVRCGLVRDSSGQEFECRIPWYLNQYRYRDISATVYHIRDDGIVKLKRIRLREQI